MIRWFRCSKEKKSGTARTISAFLRRDVSKGELSMFNALNRPGSASAALPATAAAAGENSSDLILVNRIAAGDKLAMQTLFARHRTSIYRWLLRFVSSEALAEDLLSEVFLDVWRQADRFEGRSSVSTWLMSIARYKALSVRRARTEDELTEEIEAAIVDTADDPEAALQEKDRGGLLRQALTHLSPDHREIIDLVYYHDKSIAECAEVIGIPVATVKTRMFYARRKLAELVKEA
jgi:RNA polymerase sigma-70 factor, ECF subfamily